MVKRTTLAPVAPARPAVDWKARTDVMKNGLDIGKSAFIIVVISILLFHEEFLNGYLDRLNVDKITIGTITMERSKFAESYAAVTDELARNKTELAASRGEMLALRRSYASAVQALRGSQTAMQQVQQSGASGAVRPAVAQATNAAAAALRDAPQTFQTANRAVRRAESVAQRTEQTIDRLPGAESATGYGVVFGGDRSAAAATREVRLATDAGFQAHIFHRQGMFRSVAIFENRAAATAALSRLRTLSRYAADAYVVNLSTWCPGVVPQSTIVECGV